MYFARRILCLFILGLVQVIQVLGEEGECNIPEKTAMIKEVCTDQQRHEEEAKIHPVIHPVTANVTTINTTKVNCLMDKIYGTVEMVNAIRLRELLIIEPTSSNRTRSDKESRQIPGTCVLVLFYARWCIFSSQAAPNFNAVPRAFPYIKMVAIDAIKHQTFNAQYGIVGVPTLMLVHNGKPVAKLNDTAYTLGSFARFIATLTTFEPSHLLYLTPWDFRGPVPTTPSNETDYCLVLSWVFIAACALYFTSQSRWWQQFVELVQNTWRESNAQHEHAN